MAQYRVMIQDTAGLQYEVSPTGYNFSLRLNSEQPGSFTFSYADLQRIADKYETTVLNMLTAKLTKIWVERKDSSDVYQILWLGYLTNMDITPQGEGDRTVTLNAIDIYGLLVNRLVGLPVASYAASDISDILWDIINDSQGSDPTYSDYGITRGADPTTVNATIDFCFENIRDAMAKLSNKTLDDGVDFDFSTSLVFNVYYPTKGTAKPNIIFDKHSLSNWKYTKPLVTSLANKVYVVGAGLGQGDQTTFRTRTGTTTNRDYWRTQEKKISDNNVTDTTVLDTIGDKQLALSQSSIPKFSAEHYDGALSWFDYGIGDTVTVNFPELDLTDDSKRVIQKDFSMDATKSIALIKTTLTDP